MAVAADWAEGGDYDRYDIFDGDPSARWASDVSQASGENWDNEGKCVNDKTCGNGTIILSEI